MIRRCLCHLGYQRTAAVSIRQYGGHVGHPWFDKLLRQHEHVQKRANVLHWFLSWGASKRGRLIIAVDAIAMRNVVV